MGFLRSKWGIKGIVASLLFSMLPLFVSPFLRESNDASIDRYANWLRNQFETGRAEVVEQAIEIARSAETADFSAFLQAFVEAYNTFSNAGSLSPADHTFIGAFRFQLLQLVSNAVVPGWMLKTLQARTSLLQKQAPPGLFYPNRVYTLIGPVSVISGADSLISLTISLFSSISPRAP